MYVIAGVTGNSGRVVAQTLLSWGENVRLVVRHADKRGPWEACGAEVVVADLDDPVAMGRAMAGASGAYLSLPRDIGATDPIAARTRTTYALALGVKRARVPHVLFLSSVGAQHTSGNGAIRLLQLAEEAIGEYAALTALRAGFFLETWTPALSIAAKDGILPSFVPATLPVPIVSSEDVGRVAAEAFVSLTPSRRVIQLTGPMDPTPQDIADTIAARSRRAVAVQEWPLEEIVSRLAPFGVSPQVAELLGQMYAGLRDGTIGWDAAPVIRGTVGLADCLAQLSM